jgi:DNA-binding LacI/PurR family transcriptional regulator
MPDAQSKRATLHDVAKVAGVSYQTVSRVVNNRPNVATETRARVLEAIRQLDYRPNQAAQMLATGRSHTLQLLMYDLEYNDPIPGMVHWAKQMGYAMAVSEFDYLTPKTSLRETLETLSARMVDGIVMMTPYPIPEYEELRKFSLGTPLVITGTARGAKLPSVVFDQQYGAELAIDHLLEFGHRRIAEITGPLKDDKRPAHYDAMMRHRCAHDRLQNRGCQPGPWVSGDFSIEGGYEAACRLLDRDEPFTAIFVGNDRMALGALHALRERGRRVPDDVSVVGYDDMLESAFFDPPLTTVRQDLDNLSRESVEYLIDLIENPETYVHQRVLYPELVIRESTRPIDLAGP